MRKFYKREIWGCEFEFAMLTVSIFSSGYSLGKLLILAGLV